METLTQYNNAFDPVITPQMKQKNFCALFSVMTALEFLKDGVLTYEKHMQLLASGIIKHSETKLFNQITFDQLINCVTVNNDKSLSKKISGVTTELLKEFPDMYMDMFMNKLDEDHAIMFLKNGNFFVILIKNKQLYIRDSHESLQYGPFTETEMIQHLNTAYKFNTIINIDGYVIEEYSNIEYFIVTKDMANKFIPLELKSVDDIKQLLPSIFVYKVQQKIENKEKVQETVQQKTENKVKPKSVYKPTYNITDYKSVPATNSGFMNFN